jgi:hypothetical protein
LGVFAREKEKTREWHTIGGVAALHLAGALEERNRGGQLLRACDCGAGVSAQHAKGKRSVSSMLRWPLAERGRERLPSSLQVSRSCQCGISLHMRPSCVMEATWPSQKPWRTWNAPSKRMHVARKWLVLPTGLIGPTGRSQRNEIENG